MNCDESDLLSELFNIVQRVLNFAERDGGGGVDDDCECILVHIRTIRGGIFWRGTLKGGKKGKKRGRGKGQRYGEERKEKKIF